MTLTLDGASAPTPMQISRTAWPVTVLGPGRRAAVWVQGCTIGCKGCASRNTWDPAGGTAATVLEVLRWLDALPEYVDGVTVSGGEPFQQPEALAELIAGVRQWRTGVDVLVFSGYTLARLRRDERLWGIAESCDAVVSGPYVGSAGYGGWLRGSANQELTLFTELARERYAQEAEDGRSLQIQTDGDRLDLIGIPKPGDLDRIARGLADRGVEVEGATWRP